MPIRVTLEVVVYNIEGALRAQEGGADRIELCDNPGEGGTTPSFGTLETLRQNINIDLFVMIRPRGGDFVYSNYEFHAMKRDIWQGMRCSADGVVLGILNPDGTLDKKRCKELIDRARPMKVTCHRAFDLARDPAEALEDCIEAGFDRILTSGGHSKAIQGIDVLRKLQQQAAGRISLMAGSGVDTSNAHQLISETGISELHFSAAAFRDSAMQYRNPNLRQMGATDVQDKVRSVDAGLVRKMRELVDRQQL
jgi:copper homeostasis protein